MKLIFLEIYHTATSHSIVHVAACVHCHDDDVAWSWIMMRQIPPFPQNLPTSFKKLSTKLIYPALFNDCGNSVLIFAPVLAVKLCGDVVRWTVGVRFIEQRLQNNDSQNIHAGGVAHITNTRHAASIMSGIQQARNTVLMDKCKRKSHA